MSAHISIILAMACLAFPIRYQKLEEFRRNDDPTSSNISSFYNTLLINHLSEKVSTQKNGCRRDLNQIKQDQTARLTETLHYSRSQLTSKVSNIQDSTIDVKTFGAKGDGVTDDAASIQSAIDYANTHPAKNQVVIPAGTYLVSPLYLKSNISLILSSKTILKSTSHYKEGQKILNIISQNNIKIIGHNAIVTMDRNIYSTGEQRFGLWMNNAKDIIVYNLICKNCGGDGFCIGGIMAIPCQHITLVKCEGFNNRRNGLSITNAIDVQVLGGEFSGSHGTAPEFGIDLEPDSQFEGLEDILISGVTTKDNKGGGICIAPGNLTKGAGSKNPVTIDIENCKSINDGKMGALLFANSGNAQSILKGFIKIKNLTIKNPSGENINYLRWNQHNKPAISFESVHVEKQGHLTKLY